MQNTAGPTILKTPDISQTAAAISKNPKNWFRQNILLVIILVVILLGAVFGAVSYFSPQTAKNLNVLQPQINEMSPARLSLVPEKTSYKKGETVVINVKLYTGGHATTSTDLAVKYDPSFLKAQTGNFVSVGQIYPDYPPVQIDEKQGLIGVSGINFEATQTFSGIGLFAKLNFIALKDGETEVAVNFTPGETGDSNVLLYTGATDILGAVDNARVMISETSAQAGESKSKSCGNFTQYCEDATGAVGTQICNTGTINNVSCSYDPKLTVSCEACKI